VDEAIAWSIADKADPIWTQHAHRYTRVPLDLYGFLVIITFIIQEKWNTFNNKTN
jgi:hypothetical protein